MIEAKDRFSFLEGVVLTEKDLEDEELEWWVEPFLVEKSLTMIYSIRGQGKTYFTYALAKRLLREERLNAIFYLDGDNGKRQLKDRNVGKELMKDSRFHYILHEALDVTAPRYLKRITEEAKGDIFKGCVFIIDSARDWCSDIKNDKKAREFMQSLKRLRKCGGTVFIIHHLTKSGRYVDGSGELEKSLDNSFMLKQRAKGENRIHYIMKVEKERDPVKEVSYSVNTITLDLESLDDVYATMTPEEEAFIEKAQSTLKKAPDGLNQSQLLKALGYDRTSKVGAARIKKYTSSHWRAEKRGSRTIYLSL